MGISATPQVIDPDNNQIAASFAIYRTKAVESSWNDVSEKMSCLFELVVVEHSLGGRLHTNGSPTSLRVKSHLLATTCVAALVCLGHLCVAIATVTLRKPSRWKRSVPASRQDSDNNVRVSLVIVSTHAP